MSTININCPHCDKPNRVPTHALDAALDCNVCRKTLIKGQVIKALPHNLAPLSNASLPLVVFISGPNCRICKSYVSIFADFAKTNREKYLFTQAYLPHNKPLAAKLKIRGVPAIAVYRRGKLRGVLNGGARAKQLSDFINDSLS